MPTFNKPNDLNKVWADTGTRLAPDDNKISLGWIVEAPPYQEMNYVHHKQDSALAHINQHGFPVWDNQTEYRGGISWTLGTNGNVYACKTTHTNQNPVTDASQTFWQLILNRNSLISVTQTTTYTRDLLTSANSSTARTKLGITTTGNNLVTATTSAAARSSLGSTTVGDALFTATSATNARNTLGATSVGSSLFTAANAASARTTIGITPAGSNLITQSSTSDMRNYLGVVQATEDTNGTAQIATDLEMNNGTNDQVIVTPKKLKFGFAISLAINGYIKFPPFLGNLTIQWGINGSNVGANVAQLVNYPIPFPNSVFQVVGTYSNDGAPSTKSIVNIYDLTNTNFKYNHSVSGIHTVRWIAVGY